MNRTSELRLADVDWALVERWASAERARELGYHLEMVDGAFPENRRADAATFHHIMQTAPRENLDIGDTIIDANFVAELDEALRGRVERDGRHSSGTPEGACVGGTEVTFEPSDPETAHQQNTGIDAAHRGLGLAKWAKAVMLQRIRQERPGPVRVRTDNAFSNAPMVAINDALGFRVVSTRSEWQLDLGDSGHRGGAPSGDPLDEPRTQRRCGVRFWRDRSSTAGANPHADSMSSLAAARPTSDRVPLHMTLHLVAAVDRSACLGPAQLLPLAPPLFTSCGRTTTPSI